MKNIIHVSLFVIALIFTSTNFAYANELFTEYIQGQNKLFEMYLQHTSRIVKITDESEPLAQKVLDYNRFMSAINDIKSDADQSGELTALFSSTLNIFRIYDEAFRTANKKQEYESEYIISIRICFEIIKIMSDSYYLHPSSFISEQTYVNSLKSSLNTVINVLKKQMNDGEFSAAGDEEVSKIISLFQKEK